MSVSGRRINITIIFSVEVFAVRKPERKYKNRIITIIVINLHFLIIQARLKITTG
jgi:hypothetical protein